MTQMGHPLLANGATGIIFRYPGGINTTFSTPELSSRSNSNLNNFSHTFQQNITLDDGTSNHTVAAANDAPTLDIGDSKYY